MSAAAVMQEYVDAVSRQDLGAAFGLFAPDIVFRVPGRSPYAGVYRVRGKEIVEIWIYEADQYLVDELFSEA